MPVAPPPPKQPPKSPPPKPTNGNVGTATTKTFTVAKATESAGQRIVIYGVGGIGKTSLAASAPNPVFIDLDGSVGQVAPGARIVDGIEEWQDLRDALREPSLWTDCKSIVIDSGTKAQDLAIAHTLATVKHEKGTLVSSIEGYGYGKGYQHVYETFLCLMADLDEHVRQGRTVILVCHCLTDTAPNPEGEDYKRYEPDLQQPPKTGRIRDRVKNWCDHLFFVNYDIAVSKGKAQGGGSRTIYCAEMPTFWAKSRKLEHAIPYDKGSTELWDQLFGGAK